VRPLLEAAGHAVYTPTCTGLGERAHLANPAVDLDTHITDVVNAILYEDLRDVVLVGHSYGGMVVTGVAERVPERLAHLVYVDAFVPLDGQSLMDLVGPTAAARFEEQARTHGDGWRVPPVFAPSPHMPGSDRRLPHPLASMRQPLRVTDPAAATISRTYVYCNNPPMGFFEPFSKRAKAEGWRYEELATDHNPQYMAPGALADLLGAAGTASPATTRTLLPPAG
jgi:pimeloyl-ACP methyl ester carboxylesterase